MLVYGRDMPTSTLQTNKNIVILKRRKVKELKLHLNKTQIAKRLAVTPAFVRRWWDKEDTLVDERGWKKGRLRRRTDKEKERIIKIRKRLVDERSLFYGHDEVLREYHRLFPCSCLPPRSFVAEVIKRNCKVERRKKRVPGGSKYLHYPEATIKTLGKTIQEIDFAGGRTLKGEKKIIHLFFRVYTQPFKLPLVSRINSPSGQEALNILVEDWKKYSLPDILKMDNDTAFMATGRYHELWLSKFICTILNLGITPCFTAYNKPWNNGCVEGANSVFVRKILKKTYIKNASHLEEEMDKFNQAYFRRLKGISKDKTLSETFAPPLVKQTTLGKDLKKPTIYFIRQVLEEDGQPAISVFKVPTKLDKQYLKQFVLVKLDVYDKKLTVFYEITPGKLTTVKSMNFLVRYR